MTLYTPERETYIVDEDGLIQKVEKIMVKIDDDDNTLLSYICYDIHGYREVVEEEDASPFFMDPKSGSVTEGTMKYLISLFVEGAESEITEQLTEYFGIKDVVKKDGTSISIDEYLK